MERADLEESWAEAAENSGRRRAGHCKGYRPQVTSEQIGTSSFTLTIFFYLNHLLLP
jgi:hypothetical protein